MINLIIFTNELVEIYGKSRISQKAEFSQTKLDFTENVAAVKS